MPAWASLDGLNVPEAVIFVQPTTLSVLPPTHMRQPHESAFTAPSKPPPYSGSTTPTTTSSSRPATPSSSYSSSFSLSSSPGAGLSAFASLRFTTNAKTRPYPSLDRPFVAYHEDFLYEIVGDDPSIRAIIREPDGKDEYHEAGVWLDSTQQVFLTSNRFPERVTKDHKTRLHKGMIDMHLLDLSTDTPSISTLPTSTALPAPNGACLLGDKLLICDQGYGDRQLSRLILLDPASPSTPPTPILNNFHGRPFNSLNDVVVLPWPHNPDPARATIWFTDPTYGHEQAFKPPACLPPQVYCFNPWTGALRVVADGFVSPNGIAISKDGKRCYVTDTGMFHGAGSIDGKRPGTIYVFDVVYPSLEETSTAANPCLSNRMVFAMTDAGAPDGIKLDTKGNVYAGCSDGVHVWNKYGTLLGKFLFPIPATEGDGFRTCANFCFIPDGRMVCMAEDQIFLVEGLRSKGALLP